MLSSLLIFAYLCSPLHFTNIFSPFDWEVSSSRKEYEQLVALPGWYYPKIDKSLIGSGKINGSGSSSSCNGERCYLDVNVSIDDSSANQSIHYTWNNLGLVKIEHYKYKHKDFYPGRTL
jgi:hypothetical protein